MALNKLTQKQVVGSKDFDFIYLGDQLGEIEGRTRVPAKLRYNMYHQWAGGDVKINTDHETYLDQLTIADGQTSATFISYAIDTGSLGNVKYSTFDIVEVIPSGASTTYYTRVADTEEAIATAAWNEKGENNKITSPNSRFIQFKVVMVKGVTAPIIESVALGVMGAAATQEVYDARGGYKTLPIRLEQMSRIGREDYVAVNGQTTFAIPNNWTVSGNGTGVLVYVNGQLQTYGSDRGYLFSNDGKNVIFNVGLEAPSGGDADMVTVIAANAGGYLREITVIREIPTGVVDGVNTEYVIEHNPILNSEEVFLSGVLLYKGSGEEDDYTMSGKTVTMNYPLIETEKLAVSYRYSSY